MGTQVGLSGNRVGVVVAALSAAVLPSLTLALASLMVAPPAGDLPWQVGLPLVVAAGVAFVVARRGSRALTSRSIHALLRIPRFALPALVLLAIPPTDWLLLQPLCWLLAWGLLLAGTIVALFDLRPTSRSAGAGVCVAVLAALAGAAPFTAGAVIDAGLEFRLRLVEDRYLAQVQQVASLTDPGLAHQWPSLLVEPDPLRVGWVWSRGVLDNVQAVVYASDVEFAAQSRHVFPTNDNGLVSKCRPLFGPWLTCIFN